MPKLIEMPEEMRLKFQKKYKNAKPRLSLECEGSCLHSMRLSFLQLHRGFHLFVSTFIFEPQPCSFLEKCITISEKHLNKIKPEFLKLTSR